MNDMNTEEDTGLLARIKESPRTVSALIIILIVAAAIYAFSADETAPTTAPGDQIAIDTSTEVAPEDGEESPAADNAEDTPTPAESVAPASTPVTQDSMREQAAQLPEPRKTDAGYVEVTQAGEGTTHLARRAVTRYLSENQTDFAVTNEHRIYIEDYIKDRVGTKGLSIGEEQTISYDLIREAVTAAKDLNDTQLRNLSQYTYVLS